VNRGDVILVRFPHPSGVRGKKRPAVVSCLLVATVDTSSVAQVLGTLSPTMKLKLNEYLRASLGIP
jgi:mRNA-degrading endonuclease toxin of MazEF toxin-antitoxin module